MIETILKIEEVEDYNLTNNDGWNKTGSGYIVTTDKQEIVLVISNHQDCCEHWGYFWTNSIINDFIGSELFKITEVDNCLNKKVYEKEIGLSSDGRYDRDDRPLFINLETSVGVLQFVLFNSHNGYYGHQVLINSTWVNIDTYL